MLMASSIIQLLPGGVCLEYDKPTEVLSVNDISMHFDKIMCKTTHLFT